MANSFTKRYADGECAQVWQEIRQIPHHYLASYAEDILSVAEEFVRRSKANLKTIHERLIELNYEFANPAVALNLATAQEPKEVDEIENSLGVLPIIIKIWYRNIGNVDFRQSKNQLFGNGPMAGLGRNTPLVILEPKLCLQLRAQLLYRPGPSSQNEWLEGFLPIGGFASNCNPRGIHLQKQETDPVIYDEGFGEVAFTDSLREAFRWGGFPFWGNNQVALPPPRPQFSTLLPILREGLIQI